MSTTEPGLLGDSLPPAPTPSVALGSSAGSSKSSNGSQGSYSRQSLKSLERLLGDDRDPRKLQKLVHKMYDNLKFEKERADYAGRRASEAISYLKSIYEDKLRAMQEISRLEEELKLYKIQYEEAQKEIFRAQNVIGEVDERRFQAEREAADARSTIRRMREGINVMKAQDEGRRQGVEEGLKKGREMGYQEGLKLAQSELENIARAGPPLSFNSPIPSQISHPRPRSETPANVSSTLPPQIPPSPAVPPDLVLPVSPPTHPGPKEPGLIRSPNASPSPYIPLSAIPPDNFIPRLEEDNKIHLPPPHEFSRPPPSPEPVVAPVENEDPKMIPPMMSTNFHPSLGRLSSPTSASTTLSHMDMIADPNHVAGRSPMSAIPEEDSPETRNAASLARQPSLGAQSARLMTSSPSGPIYSRPRATSRASSISFQPPVIPDADPHDSVSTASSSTPHIKVLPPPTPGPRSTGLSSDPQSGPARINLDNESLLSLVPEADPRPNFALPFGDDPVTMPSDSLQDHWGYGFENTSGHSMNPPVIPHPDLYTNVDDEEDIVSSGFGSEGSLRTPLTKHGELPGRTGSTRTTLSRPARSTGVGGQSRASGSQTGSSKAGSVLGS